MLLNLYIGSDVMNLWLLVGLGGTTMPDVIGIVKDVILVILPAPHPRCVAAGTCQCSC